jgi:hypothetical protein
MNIKNTRVKTLLIAIIFFAGLQGQSACCRPMRKDIPFLDRQEQFTINVAHLIEFIYSRGYSCTFGETFRTKAQALLNAHQGIGIQDSNHCYRLAIDLNLFDSKGTYLHTVKDYLTFGKYWEKLNVWNEWGGRWKNGDANHFEMD